jgi:LacI family transcriptional regulator
VIGVDNDELVCNLSSPPLTSVDVNTPEVGYQAAALLSRLMQGEPRPAEPMLLPPRAVVARSSTDVVTTEDRELAAAIRYVRQHACDGLRLKTFLGQTGLSPRTLERRMIRLLGRSPKEEITRVRLEKAKSLLTGSDASIKTIAGQCGYSQPRYFCQVFHAKVGVSPGEYRRSSEDASAKDGPAGQ